MATNGKPTRSLPLSFACALRGQSNMRHAILHETRDLFQVCVYRYYHVHETTEDYRALYNKSNCYKVLAIYYDSP